MNRTILPPPSGTALRVSSAPMPRLRTRHQPIPAIVVQILSVVLLFIVAAAMVSMLSGCRGNDLHLVMQTPVDDETYFNAQSAVALWSQQLAIVDPARVIDIVRSTDHDFSAPLGEFSDVVPIYISERAECGHTQKYIANIGERIDINPTCPGTFRDKSAHEYGHALGMISGGVDGLGHVPDGTGIMGSHAYGFDTSGDSHPLTCMDMRGYCTIHHCVARPEACR
jgi:hypothetical protein